MLNVILRDAKNASVPLFHGHACANLASFYAGLSIHLTIAKCNYNTHNIYFKNRLIEECACALRVTGRGGIPSWHECAYIAITNNHKTGV